MKIRGRGRLAIFGALVALAGLGAAPPAEAAPRETRPLFSLPKQLRMPWSQPAKPAKRQRRAAPKAAKPPPPASAAAPPLPRPAPEPKTGGATAPAPISDVAARSDDAPPPAAAEAPAVPASPQPAAPAPTGPPSGEDDAAASGSRAAGFAALRPASPEPPPLAPLPSQPDPEEAPPRGPVARGVPLPPTRDRAPDAPAPAPETAVAMMPRAPLDGPPLPGPPDADTPPPVVAPEPSARGADPECSRLVREDVAIAKPLPPLLGPGSCGAPLPVELTGVRLADGSVVDIKPAAILRCETARTVATFVRDDLAPAAAKAGPALAEVRTAASYVCRGRNNRANAKMSEHGLANALDVSGFAFKDGGEFGVYDRALPQAFSAAVKSAACARFATVLGPGSDGYHEEHLHLDLRKRRNAASKLCRWPGS